MFPTDQYTHATHKGIRRAQTRAVAHSPDHTLAECWHDFSVAVNQCAIAVEEQIGVVKSSVPRAVFNTLVDSDTEHETELAREGTERVCVGTWDDDTVFC